MPRAKHDLDGAALRDAAPRMPARTVPRLRPSDDATRTPVADQCPRAPRTPAPSCPTLSAHREFGAHPLHAIGVGPAPSPHHATSPSGDLAPSHDRLRRRALHADGGGLTSKGASCGARRRGVDAPGRGKRHVRSAKAQARRVRMPGAGATSAARAAVGSNGRSGRFGGARVTAAPTRMQGSLARSHRSRSPARALPSRRSSDRGAPVTAVGRVAERHRPIVLRAPRALESLVPLRLRNLGDRRARRRSRSTSFRGSISGQSLSASVAANSSRGP